MIVRDSVGIACSQNELMRAIGRYSVRKGDDPLAFASLLDTQSRDVLSLCESARRIQNVAIREHRWRLLRWFAEVRFELDVVVVMVVWCVVEVVGREKNRIDPTIA